MAAPVRERGLAPQQPRELYAPEVRSDHLPPMEYRDMPEPLPLRKVLGPSVIDFACAQTGGVPKFLAHLVTALADAPGWLEQDEPQVPRAALAALRPDLDRLDVHLVIGVYHGNLVGAL